MHKHVFVKIDNTTTTPRVVSRNFSGGETYRLKIKTICSALKKNEGKNAIITNTILKQLLCFCVMFYLCYKLNAFFPFYPYK